MATCPDITFFVCVYVVMVIVLSNSIKFQCILSYTSVLPITLQTFYSHYGFVYVLKKEWVWGLNLEAISLKLSDYKYFFSAMYSHNTYSGLKGHSSIFSVFHDF